MSDEEKKEIDHSKMMKSAKERGASPARLRALMKMEIKRKQARRLKIRKTIDK
jgi:hypothetical protein